MKRLDAMRLPSANPTLLMALALCATAFLLPGCAVHYYDKTTGTEHLWGFGHLEMRAVPQRGDRPPFTNAVVAFVTGVRTLGLNFGAGDDFAGVAAGWDSRSRLVITAKDSHFYLLWPTNTIWLPKALSDHFFNVRVGPDFPFTNGACMTNSKVNQPTP
ncbi:MAG: hypothetical protein ACYDH9_19115 [Limisphaerales bacterium]